MSSMNSMRLKELIRTVRLCKTSAEERALVNREFSSIKEGFKAGTPYLRNRNMLKLLYLSMLGYPVQFGQLEVINLLAQEDFSGKRIGYLAMQLILSENDEVLTLVENNMKNDMAARGPLGRLVQGVALNAAANIAGVDMARDIFDEVSTLIKAELAVIRKKAFLAALTIVRKVPEYAEYFLEQCLDTVFAEGSHSVQTSELALIITCLQTKDGPAFLPRYRRLATAAARRLRSLVVGGKTSEQEVSGVAEPFLQVRLLQFMAVIGRESSATSEALSDTLAQVITNTDLTRIIGCAVTYECVRTIYALESDDGLRTLAINTIGRFLTGAKDNNLRFVALKALKQLATSHAEVVQFHHTQILDCLKDSDISIRRRALDLIVDIVTEANVRMLVPDMLVYLSMGTGGLREEVNRCVSSIIESKSPSDEWRVELSLRLLKFSRQFAKEDFAHQLIGVISTLSEEAKLRSLKQMWYEAGAPFDALQESRRVLLMVCVWSIGEYSDLLVAHHSLEPITIIQNLTDIAAHAVSPVLKQYCAMAVVKTVARFPDSKEEALKMFEVYRKSSIWDLRQRSAEFKAMIEGFPDEAAFAFSRMPPIHTTEEYHVPVMTVTADELHGLTPTALDDLFGTANPDAPQRVELDALFAAEPSMIPVASPTNTSPLTGSDPVFQREAVFRCDDFSVYLDHTRDGGVIHARVAILSSAVEAIENLSFQAAVPKTCVVEVFPLAATGISPGTVLMQLLDVNIAAYAKSQLALKVKIVYCIRGESREQTFQASRDV